MLHWTVFVSENGCIFRLISLSSKPSWAGLWDEDHESQERTALAPGVQVGFSKGR